MAKKYPNPRLVLHVDLEARGKQWGEDYVNALKTLSPNALIEVKPPLTAGEAGELLGWKVGKKKVRGAVVELPDGQWASLERNTCNRKFRLRHAQEFSQKYLTGEMRLNFETWLVGESGSVLSCQHRGVGLKLAEIEYLADPVAYRKVWPDGPPTVECLVVYGTPEDPETLATIDNTLAATTADVFFKEGFFAKAGDPALRDKLTRTLAVAVDLLWRRTGVTAEGSRFQFSTNGLRLAFLKRHPRLAEAAQFCFERNQPVEEPVLDEDGNEVKDDNGEVVMARGGPQRIAVEKVGFRPGQAAALLYLMGACDTDPQKYRKGGVGQEKFIDWGPDDANWKKAQEFWANFADRSNGFEAVHKALIELIPVQEGGQVGFDWRVSVVWKAWEKFLEGTRLQYTSLVPKDNGRLHSKLHKDWEAFFKGIDYVAADREEDDRQQREAREGDDGEEVALTGPEGDDDKPARQEKPKKPKKAGDSNGGPTYTQRLNRLKGKYGDAVLLFIDGNEVKAWGQDAKTVAGVLKMSYGGDKATGMNVVKFPAADLNTNAAKVEAQDHKVHVAELSELMEDEQENVRQPEPATA